MQDQEKKYVIPGQRDHSQAKKEELRRQSLNQSPATKLQEIHVKKHITFAVDPDTFKQLVKNDVFVDKSLFIKEVLADNTKHILITRPRRWGKTLNFDMLKTFLQPDVDENGLIKKSNKNLALFTGGKIEGHEFKRLKIAEEAETLKQEGQWPVIFVSFKTVQTRQELRSAIKKAYKQHKYLLRVWNQKIKSPQSNFVEKQQATTKYKFFKKVCDDEEYSLQDSLYELSEILYEHFNEKQVYILIDEYDAPINNAIIENKDYQIILRTMKKLLSNAMKNNDYLKKGLMTGVLGIAKASFGSGLNNFTEYGVLGNKYAEHFGFTDNEMDQLLSKSLQQSEQTEKQKQKNQIKRWYNGYNIGGQTIYNPWSIMHCLQASSEDPKTALKEYWINTGNTAILEKAFQNLKDTEFVDQFIRTSQIQVNIDPFIGLAELQHSENAFFSILLQSGYLTKGDKYRFYRVPNVEIKKYYFQKLLPIWVKKAFGKNINTQSLINGLITQIQDCSKYKTLIQQQLLNRLDEGNKNQAYFQVLLGGISAFGRFYLQNAKHNVHCEVETPDRKRLDSIFLPIKDKSETVIIHQYKKIDKTTNEKMLWQVTEDALWQIYANRYMDVALDIKKLHQDDSVHWKFIKTRAIVFYYGDLIGKWSVQVTQYKHAFEEAYKLNQIFGSFKEQLVSSNQKKRQASRQRFLANQNAETLKNLLAAHAVQHEPTELERVRSCLQTVFVTNIFNRNEERELFGNEGRETPSKNTTTNNSNLPQTIQQKRNKYQKEKQKSERNKIFQPIRDQMLADQQSQKPQLPIDYLGNQQE